MLKTVLVALDDLDASPQIMEMVQQVKLDAATQLVLAHVIHSELIDIADVSALYVERLTREKAALPWPSIVEVVWGDPAEEIIRLAHIHHAELIVMGTRGLTGVSRVLRGSVSGQVLAEAPCSVLVIKPVRQASIT